MHNSSNCPICHGLPVEGRMTDEAFYAFLNTCRDELAVKQASFQKLIAGAPRWHYDMVEESLVFGEMTFGMTPIGTFSPGHQTWLWAWANEDFPEVARAASRQIQGLHDVTGFRVFINEGIEASLDDAQDFTALAVHQLDAIAFFRSPAEGEEPDLYLAVHEQYYEDA